MTIEEIKETVERSGDAAEIADGNPEQAAGWMQVKMLAEIALQLAQFREQLEKMYRGEYDQSE